MKLFFILLCALLPTSLWALEEYHFTTEYIDLKLEKQRLLGVHKDGSTQVLILKMGELSALDFATGDSSPRPEDILSDGRVMYGNGDIRKAWLGGPSDRYQHGVMADYIEATRLYVELADQQIIFLELPSYFVFEDRFPRFADVDDDGEAELVVIRTNIDTGAGIAVYGLKEGKLVLEAASETIGTPNRWLNIVGIEDFTGDGVREIAVVNTPHIGGKLTIFRQLSNTLLPVAAQDGYSNHQYGSRELGMSAALHIDDDGIMDMAVPDARRQDLILLTASNDRLRKVKKISNRVGIKSGIYVVQLDQDDRHELVYLLEDSTLMVLDF